MVCQGDESVHVTVAMVIKACLKCPLPKISSSAPLTADLSEKGLTHTRGNKSDGGIMWIPQYCFWQRTVSSCDFRSDCVPLNTEKHPEGELKHLATSFAPLSQFDSFRSFKKKKKTTTLFIFYFCCMYLCAFCQPRWLKTNGCVGLGQLKKSILCRDKWHNFSSISGFFF